MLLPGCNVIVLMFGLITTVSHSWNPNIADIAFAKGKCNSLCPFQNGTRDVYLDDITCELDCKIDNCKLGCDVLDKAFVTSCQHLCNISSNHLIRSGNMYCFVGCKHALDVYFDFTKEQFENLKAPVMVDDTLNSSSLTLRWMEDKFANDSYVLQYRNIDASDDWEFCQNQTWLSSTLVTVDQLRPFTKYQFRVAVRLITDDWCSIYSEPSSIIGTTPGNSTPSAPKILNVALVKCDMLSIRWEPTDFTNSPITSYVLRINELPSGFAAVKDIPATETSHSYMLRDLQPSTNYSISVSAKNSVGLGTPATITVHTCIPQTGNETEELNLIIATKHTIYSISSDINNEPVVMYNTTHTIKGIALHVHRELVFICDSSGSVLVTSSKGLLAPQEVLPANSVKPLTLSVDWLNDNLYILSEVLHPSGTIMYHVARCGLDGSNVFVVISGFIMRPHHMEVDPFNGYLFWVVRGIGLYRLDLIDISKMVNQNVSPDLMIEDHNLGAFFIDYNNFRILISLHSQNTIASVSLNSRDVANLRNNTYESQFQNVDYLTMVNGFLYWTDGERLYKEIYNVTASAYDHVVANRSLEQNYIYVTVNSLSIQPIPVPVNAPTDFQVIFGYDVAKVYWKAPYHLAGQGGGAWSSWSYKLYIEYANGTEFADYGDIKPTMFTVSGLIPGTEYAMKVAAYTSSGQGPWSPQFRGQTMRKNISLIWSSERGILLSDTTGYRVTKIEPTNFIPMDRPFVIDDMDWYEDQIFVSTNIQHVYWYNLSSSTYGRVQDIVTADCIAIEWIAPKLYWADTKRNLIYRSNLNGSKQEILPIVAQVESLLVDSTEAFLYWSAKDKVERSHFDGSARNVYFAVSNQFVYNIVGLSLDKTLTQLYWILRNMLYPNYTLLSADVNSVDKDSFKISLNKFNLTDRNIQGDVCFIDQYLISVKAHSRNAIISGLNTSTFAVTHNDNLSNLISCTAMDPSSRKFSSSNSSTNLTVNVVPAPVVGSSVHIDGSYDLFNVTWSSISSSVTYGRVFYRVRIIEQNHDTTMITDDNHVTIGNSKAYTPLRILIQSQTYWATSDPVHVTLYSPSSTPSSPNYPRVYVVHNRNPLSLQDVEVTGIFRWSPPDEPNGIIQYYEPNCWMSRNLSNELASSCSAGLISGKTLEYVLPNLPLQEIYFFKVRGCTYVGCGEWSDMIKVNFSEEFPIPKLLVATFQGLRVLDFDRKTFSVPVKNTSANTSVFAYDGFQDVVYSLEYDRIFQISLNSHASNKKEIITLSNKGCCLVYDWISRILYWAESSNGAHSQINSLDLNHPSGERQVMTVIPRTKIVSKIIVSPLHGLLLWVEIQEYGHSNSVLMRSNVDGTDMRPLYLKESISVSGKSETDCNCTLGTGSSLTGKSISLFPSDKNYKLLWVHFPTNNIVISDINGCYCTILVKYSRIKEYGLPPESLTADFNRLYWVGFNKTTMYSMDLSAPNVPVEKIPTNNIVQMEDISSFGQNLQQFPPTYCLTVRVKPGFAHLVEYSSDSITLEMPPIEKKRNCSSVSSASIEYSLFYGIVEDNGQSNCTLNLTQCSNLVTYKRKLKLSHLKPYTRYIFILGVNNYYGHLLKSDLLIGQPAVYRTAPGMPSAPRNVTARSINPNSIFVSWLPPQQLNAESVWYEVHWTLKDQDTSENGFKSSGEQVVSSKTYTFTSLENLLPSRNYTVKVRAYAQRSHGFTDSDEIEAATFSEPQPLSLINSTARTLTVSLPRNLDNIRCEIEYYSSASNKWRQLQRQKDSSYIILKNLQPVSSYTFRLRIWYDNPPYVWPHDGRFTFKTLGDKPNRPSVPIFQHYKDDIYKITWGKPYTNGGEIEIYALEGKVLVKNDVKLDFNLVDNWILYYNGSENYWTVSNLKFNVKYKFRVKAKNRYGWSDYSDLSDPVEIVNKNYFKVIAFWLIIPGFGLIGVSFLTVLIYVHNCRMSEKVVNSTSSGGGGGGNNSDKKSILNTTVRNGELELANLRDLPTSNNFVRAVNALYSSRDQEYPTNEEIIQLPQIQRDQITLTKFLGSGAFGEVYEGTVKNILYENVETKVALKSLRKNATEQEKLEFLKEAQLMSNFKHKHILRMLGVCIDNNPHFIIMELMEGGDLLSYLRSNRSNTADSLNLGITDLLGICVDVASGCKYLEEMHFVHRDLACRNCLVSSKDPQFRVVKIGDFGLARDIYKNDYYRKEGEGLLPVRWMSPESLVDGVFTRQSDVWSFGVLLWEVMTLGQQPYPARSNVEVLHYVRSGGRLPCPVNCPKKMYELMEKCWSFTPKNRPAFKYCLSALEELKENYTTASDVIDYSVMLPLTSTNENNSSQHRKNSQDESSPEIKIGNTNRCNYTNVSITYGSV